MSSGSKYLTAKASDAADSISSGAESLKNVAVGATKRAADAAHHLVDDASKLYRDLEREGKGEKTPSQTSGPSSASSTS